MDDIIVKVKDVLGVSSVINNEDLYLQLKSLRNKFHPDSQLEYKAKIEVEEKFKEYSNLMTDLENYILKDKRINKNNSTDLILKEDENIELLSKDFQLRRLKDEKERLEVLYNYNNNFIKNKNEEIRKLKNEIKEKNETEIVSNYKEIRKYILPNKAISTIPIFGMFSILVTQIPLIKNYLINILGISESIVLYIILTITVICLINWLYNKAACKIVEHIIHKILNPNYLSVRINIHTVGCYNYFTDKEIYSLIEQEIKNKLISMFFIGRKNHIIALMLNQIIDVLSKQQIIISTETKGLNTIYKISKSLEEFDKEWNIEVF